MISTIMLMCDHTNELHQYTKNAVDNLKGKEFIVVDNASTVGAGYARSSADIYIRNSENVGYPKAVNQGFKLATGELIAIANNDIRVSEGWQRVTEEIFQDETVGSVHFRMIGYEDPMILGDKTWLTGKERWCHASFFVVRREAFVMYDEGYKEGGYDDWDFFHRMRHIEGWKTAYTNNACFQHVHSATYKYLDDGKSRQERDKRNAEHFKWKFGEYAEEIWNKLYPEQMAANYWEGFE